MTTPIETLAEHACFGGVQGFYRHASTACAGPMRFGVFVPSTARGGRLPTLFWLAGLTCTEETFAIKAGAQRIAAELGMVLVTPDTSPREPQLPGDRESWDFGQGAGFYVDAAQAPWSAHYRMSTYVTEELPDLIELPADRPRPAVASLAGSQVPVRIDADTHAGLARLRVLLPDREGAEALGVRR